MRRNIPLFMLLISSCGSQNVVRTNLWKEENDMEGSTTSLLSRRRFLARLALMLGTALGAGSLLPACGDQSGEEEASEA